MAMRAIMKKIIISPRIGSMQRLNRVIPASSNSTGDRRKDYLNNEAVVRDLERILKDGKTTFHQRVTDLNSGKKDEINERWENWVDSSGELWKKKNEEEQRRDLDLYWKYLKDYLHRKGVDTSNHRLLLSVKKIGKPPHDDPERHILEVTVASPDKGLVSINRLVLDRDPYSFPRQTVNGLLCITSGKAFLIYNPITGEKSPWIETSTKHSRIASGFGFNPQSGEHEVICISNSDPFNINNNNQVVEVFTVGKNTWRRIDATPPIHIGCAGDPYYLDGCLYWRFRDLYGPPREPELVLRFDIVTEKFRVFPIPDPFIPSRWHLSESLKSSETVELTEVDGRIAVFDLTVGADLWISHEDADGNIQWTREFMNLDVKPDPSIEAVTGTNLIFVTSECSDSIFYYNRKNKEAIRFPISPDCNSHEWKRIIQV